MNFQNIDQYGNIDTNNDGSINESDLGYQTDVLLNPIGGDVVNPVNNIRDLNIYSGETVRGACLGSDNNIIPDITNQYECINSNNNKIRVDICVDGEGTIVESISSIDECGAGMHWIPVNDSEGVSACINNNNKVISGCFDSNNIFLPNIDSQDTCFGDGKQWTSIGSTCGDTENTWDPTYVISSDTPYGGCFDSEGSLLSDITSSDTCISPNTWNDGYLRDTTEYSEQSQALDAILDSSEFNNGRIGDIKLIDNIQVLRNNDVVIISDNQTTAVKGLVEETALSSYFFSTMNTKVIQDTIRYNVYKNTNFIIDYQSSEELYIIMRSILLQHGNFKVSTTDIINEIKELNKLVVQYSTGEVSSNVTQFQGYLSDLQTLPTPFDRPLYGGGTNNNTYDLTTFIGV